ncbi:hypothetical protein Tco_1444355 [Tanacetum coccineum]
MHTSRDDYLINTLRFVSAKEETQIYGAILPESLTSPEMKESKAYKTYLGFATGATPPKKARKFKNPASPKLTTVPVSTKEPTGKSKRVKRPAKKSTKAPARGVVIRETSEMPLSKKKEKVDVTRGKGIVPLSEVALAKDAQFKEVQRKRNDEDDSNNDQSTSGENSDQENDSDDDKAQSDSEKGSDSEHETDENESGSESDQDKNEKDIEDEVKNEFVKTPSNDSDDEDETKITDKAEGDEDEEMDYTTSQLYDDVDIRLNEPVDTDKGFIQEEVYSTIIPQSLPSFTPPPQKSTSIPPPTTEATNPQYALPNLTSVFQFNNRVTTLEKEVVELKKDPLKTQVTAIVDEYLDARLGSTRDEFISHLLASITARIIEQVKNQLPQIVPKEVSNFAPTVIQNMVIESLEQAVLAKESSQPQSLYEAAATLTKF